MYVTNHKLYFGAHHLPLGRRWANIAQRVAHDNGGGGGALQYTLYTPRAIHAYSCTVAPRIHIHIMRTLSTEISPVTSVPFQCAVAAHTGVPHSSR